MITAKEYSIISPKRLFYRQLCNNPKTIALIPTGTITNQYKTNNCHQAFLMGNWMIDRMANAESKHLSGGLEGRDQTMCDIYQMLDLS